MENELFFKKLTNKALSYLEKYDACEAMVQQVLERKIQKEQQTFEISSEVKLLIKEVVKKLVSLGYVDDTRYAENQIRLLKNAGKSLRFTLEKLKQKGLSSEILKQLIQDENEQTDRERAQIFMRKKKISPMKKPQNNQEYLLYQKVLGKFARAGFSFEVAQAVLTEKEEDL